MVFFLSEMQHFPPYTCLYLTKNALASSLPPGLCGPFPFSSLSLFSGSWGQTRSSGYTRQSRHRLLRTAWLGSNTMATLSIFDNIPFGQSLISCGPGLISLQLRLICMAVNTGLTKLTNCDKSKGNLRPLETPKSAFSIWAWLWVTPQPRRLPARACSS